MNHPLYDYSLCAALALMLFFGIYFLTARSPQKSIFDNYLRSRRIIGYRLAATGGKLYRTHAMRIAVFTPGFSHFPESVNLLPRCLAIQFRSDRATRSELLNPPSHPAAH